MLPHNFIELLNAAIDLLKGKKIQLFPDFLTGGKIDVSDYNDGKRGGKVRVRATIEEVDSKTLIVKDIPYGTTTTSVIESIVKANDKGKIKIKQVVDNTAQDIEILIKLAPGTSPDITVDALFAFTDCEVSISPNACIIHEDKPKFVGITEILKHSVDQTMALLKRELEIRRDELMEKRLFSSLEKIFIENRIYRDIEECETWEAVLQTIDKGLDPFKPEFYREITQDDIVRLTEIKIKRISKFDSFKADELMRRLGEELEETENYLANLTSFGISYYQNLLDKYSKGKERKTEIANFETISANVVAANNAKLYVNREDGFIGYGIKKDEFVSDCSDIDDVIVFRKDGICQVTRIQEKVFVGKNIIHVGVFKKGDERMVYNLIYVDAKSGRTMAKRFQVLSVTRDREYELTKGGKASKIQYFSANPNGEAETVTVFLTAASSARKKVFDFDFSEIEIKGRAAGGNILTKYPVRKIQFKAAGVSTLGGLDVWYDTIVGRLNTDGRGDLLGNFQAEDQIVVFYKDGSYELTSFEISNRFDVNQMMSIGKFRPQLPVNAVYYEGDSKTYFVKRFMIETTSPNKRFGFIGDSKNSKLVFANNAKNTKVEAVYKEGNKKEMKEFDLSELIDVKGWKAIGNKFPVQTVQEIRPMIEEAVEAEADLENLKNAIKGEVEEEDNQLGLFGGGNKE